MIINRGFRYKAHGSTFVVVRKHSKRFGWICVYRTGGDRRHIQRVPAVDILLLLRTGVAVELK